MRKIRYALFIKGLVFLLVGFYLAGLGLPSSESNFSIHIGQAVTENTGDNSEDFETKQGLQRIYRIAGPIMLIIGFIEILLGILTYLGYRKE